MFTTQPKQYRSDNRHQQSRKFSKKQSENFELEQPTVYQIPYGVDIHWFSKDGKHEVVGHETTLNIAVESMKKLGSTEKFSGTKTDRWVLHYTDQFGNGHYERWMHNFSTMFPYSDEYAEKSNKMLSETGRNPAIIVDPPFPKQC